MKRQIFLFCGGLSLILPSLARADASLPQFSAPQFSAPLVTEDQRQVLDNGRQLLIDLAQHRDRLDTSSTRLWAEGDESWADRGKGWADQPYTVRTTALRA